MTLCRGMVGDRGTVRRPIALSTAVVYTFEKKSDTSTAKVLTDATATQSLGDVQSYADITSVREVYKIILERTHFESEYELRGTSANLDV